MSHLKTIGLLVACALLLPSTALAGKNKKDKGEEEAAAEAAPEPTTPGDAASKKFAEGLVDATIQNFNPTDAQGATFVYVTMSFLPDNTWKAKGYVEIIDERMECAESGTWTMEPAESDTVATVNWTVDKTDCGGRDAGEKTRAQVTLQNGTIDVLFR